MPIYEYECRKCGVFDYEHSMSARPLARCPRCRSKVTKLISATAFHLKGGGWYADGYDRKKATGDAETKSEVPAAAESGAAEKPSTPPAAPEATPGPGKKTGSKKAARSGKSAAA